MTERVEHIGGATLYLGDCRTILPALSGVDAVVTDPPYGTQDLGGGYGRRQNWDTGDGNGRTILFDRDLSVVAEVWPLFSACMTSGWVAAFFSARKTPEFIAATTSVPWFGSLVWYKGAPGLGYHIRYNHESIGVFRIGNPSRPPDAIISTLQGWCDPTDHPHAKPVSVVTRIVEWASTPGSVVCDPFAGSGTTGVACARLGRRFVGIEIHEPYFDIACRRIEQAYRQRDLFVDAPVAIDHSDARCADLFAEPHS